jgi:hypothetical protein
MNETANRSRLDLPCQDGWSKTGSGTDFVKLISLIVSWRGGYGGGAGRAGPPVHLPFEHLDTVDVAFDGVSE